MKKAAHVKSPAGIRQSFTVIAALALLLLAAAGCGSKVCSAYGGKQVSSGQAQIIE